jgi:OFA family oxalate/formate antiporter-like MFS transporter
VAGALVIQAILGTVYAYSVFVKPLEQQFGWGRATTQWGFSVALATFALTMIPAGRLQDRVGPRRVALIGGGLLGLAFVLGSVLIAADRPWALFLTYGVIGGAGIGFGYVCPIAAAVKWFPDKKGLVTGLAVAGFGAGSLFFAGPASELLQPMATEGGPGLGELLLIGLGFGSANGSGLGWQRFFVVHGVVSAAAVALGALLLRNPPPGWQVPAARRPQPAGAARTQARVAMPEMDWREMLNTPLGTMMWLSFIFGATSGLLAIGQWQPMMGEVLGTQRFAPAWLGSFGRFLEPVGILALFNALGRLFWGRVSDWIERPRALMLMYIAQGVAFLFLVAAQTPLTVFLASAWVGLNFGGNFALYPAATADNFGAKHFGVNYGFIFTAYGVAGILGPAAGGVLFESTRSYLLAFIFSGVLCFLAAGCAVVLWGLERARRLELELSRVTVPVVAAVPDGPTGTPAASGVRGA